MTAMMTSCSTAFNIGCKNHAADLVLIGSGFSQALLQETFTV